MKALGQLITKWEVILTFLLREKSKHQTKSASSAQLRSPFQNSILKGLR